MITKNDCVLLLTEVQNRGENVSPIIKRLVASRELTEEALKTLYDNKMLDIVDFYEHIRKSYNQKKSKLYINIVKEIDDTTEVLTTLSALLTQILLFSSKCSNREMFMKHARADEIAMVLGKYFETYDITSCLSLLRLIKIDLKALESFKS